MYYEYKVGDKVKCVKGQDYNLKEGEIYTIEDISAPGFLQLEGQRNNSYTPSRFEPVFPSPKHKHYREITAYAYGAEIQYYSSLKGRWVTIEHPGWSKDDIYRIKPPTPLITPQQQEIESVRKEMEGLAKRLKELENHEK